MSTAIDLSKLITISNTVTVTDLQGTKKFMFRRQEQYQYENIQKRMEGCSCSGGQEEITYYRVIICERTYDVNALFAFPDRTLREAEYTFLERQDAMARTVPDGGFSQFDNYHPDARLEQMNKMFKDRTNPAWNRYIMKRTPAK